MGRIFVGNLPYDTSSEDLQNLFADLGTIVNCNIITDKYSGRSRGFGFVQFESDEIRDKAVAKFHNSQYRNHMLVVNPARK